ncbi:MAG TPA: acyl-CoA carboxylase subunit epsilon [Microlunatus sp.]|nr:acyl-CoA carboxylase subunit epsilon [Microlunatus sp.]
MTSSHADPVPVVEVLRGAPTAEEIAALVVALSWQRGTTGPPEAETRGSEPAGGTDGWAARWRGLRTSLRPGPGAWRLSGRD